MQEIVQRIQRTITDNHGNLLDLDIIRKYQRFVLNGWNPAFENDPAFAHFKPTESKTENYLMRLCLLKFISEEYLNSRANTENVTWFRQARNKLNEEFNELAYRATAVNHPQHRLHAGIESATAFGIFQTYRHFIHDQFIRRYSREAQLVGLFAALVVLIYCIVIFNNKATPLSLRLRHYLSPPTPLLPLEQRRALQQFKNSAEFKNDFYLSEAHLAALEDFDPQKISYEGVVRKIPELLTHEHDGFRSAMMTKLSADQQLVETTPEERKQFIEMCKGIIDDQILPQHKEAVEALRPVFNLINNPKVEGVFQKSLVLFMRLFLFKQLVAVCTEDPTLADNDATWFRHARDTLQREFAQCKRDYTYQGQALIHNPELLNALFNEAQAKAKFHETYISPNIPYIGGGIIGVQVLNLFYNSRFVLNQIIQNAFLGAFMLFAWGVHRGHSAINKTQEIKTLWKQLEEQRGLEKPELQATFFVSDAALEVLEEKLGAKHVAEPQ